MIKNLLGDENARPTELPEDLGTNARPSPQVFSIFDSTPEANDKNPENEVFVISTADPETFGQTARRSGLAWSAGIVFFASITFMLILGWGADLLLGSSPWGIVGGIVVGSVIGFIQFFRLTSQIFRN